MERSKLDLKTNTELVEIMWEQFCDLGKYEANVIDTTAQTVSETVQSIKAHLKSGQNRIMWKEATGAWSSAPISQST